MSLARDVRSALDRLTTPPVATAAAGVLLVLLLGVVGLHVATLKPPGDGRFELGTGDFLAFWTGAVAIDQGAGHALYDFDAQKRLQSEILGAPAPSFQPYLNPPLLAVLLAPLVPLGYLGAFYVFDVSCIAALAAGIALLLRATPAIRSSTLGAWTLALAVASFQPMLQTTLGGQNTPITFALLALLAAALRSGSAPLAAVALGLLSYKPQYAVGIGVALLLAGRVGIAAGGAALGLLHALLGAWFCGWRWPFEMMAFMQRYRPMELADNAGTHFSWVRTADYLLPSPLDSFAGAAGVAAVLYAWWRCRGLARPGTPQATAWLALVVTGTMLASPHQQFYDSALLALPVALLVERDLAAGRLPSLGVRVALAFGYAAYPLWDWHRELGVQPLFFALALVALWSLRACSDAGYASPIAGSRSHAG